MRKTAMNMVFELAKKDARILFVGSDLGFGVMDDMLKIMPQRVLREGICEQHVMGMASGLALEGKIVYVNTIASFLIRRAYEQIYLDLCLNKARVRLLASGGGLVYAPLGPTHLAPDDIAALRPLPNMTILAPCDALEMARLMQQTPAIDGPVYVRFAKGGDKIVTKEDAPCEIGKAVIMAEGKDIVFISCGITAQIALEAREILQNKGISAAVLHCHTLKPLDAATILHYVARTRMLIVIEEHIRTGGLGSAVGEILLSAKLPQMPRFLHLALPDAFFSEHGSQAQIMAAHGLSAQNAVRLVLEA